MSPDEGQLPRQSDTERTAPVQGGRSGPDVRIPWDIHVRAWQVYAAAGYGDQSAERIAERGGFSYGELVQLLAECDPFAQDRRLLAPSRRRLEEIRARGLEALSA